MHMKELQLNLGTVSPLIIPVNAEGLRQLAQLYEAVRRRRDAALTAYLDHLKARVDVQAAAAEEVNRVLVYDGYTCTKFQDLRWAEADLATLLNAYMYHGFAEPTVTTRPEFRDTLTGIAASVMARNFGTTEEAKG